MARRKKSLASKKNTREKKSSNASRRRERGKTGSGGGWGTLKGDVHGKVSHGGEQHHRRRWNRFWFSLPGELPQFISDA